MKRFISICLSLIFMCGLAACSNTEREDGSLDEQETSPTGVESMQTGESPGNPYTVDTLISDVIADPVFGDYGRLIFPVDTGYYSGDTLGSLRLTWYSNIDPDKTVEITNYMKEHAGLGVTIFYDI